MKNTENKTKRSGVILSLIAVMLIAFSLCAALLIYKNTVNESFEEKTAYVRFDFLHSYEMTNMIFASMNNALEGGTRDEYVIAVKDKNGDIVYESFDGAYDMISGGEDVLFEYKDGEAHMSVPACGKVNADYIKTIDTKRTSYLGYISKLAEKYPDGQTVTVRPYKYSNAKAAFFLIAFAFWAAAAAAAAGTVLLILSFFAKGKREAYRRISEKFTSNVFFEIKWLVSAAVLIFGIYCVLNISNGYGYTLTVCARILFSAFALWYTVFGSKVLYYDMMTLGIGGYFKKTFLVWLIKGASDLGYRERPFKKLTFYTVVYIAVSLAAALTVPVLEYRFGEAASLIPIIFLAVFTAAYCALTFPLLRDLDILSKKLIKLSRGEGANGTAISKRSDAYPLSLALDDLESGCRVISEKAMREERTRIELITNVSHDLKTPLTSIISYTELLSGIDDLGEEAAEYVSVISNKEQRLKKLIEDLFELSKATTANIEMNICEIDLTTLLKQQFSYNSDAIDASGLDFNVDLPEYAVMINADGARLHQVIENLIVNALKYSLPDSRVYASLKADGEKAVFEMKNISKDKLPADPSRLTERFVRGDESRTEEGSGLGLAIAKTYTQLCGGEFDVTTDGDLFKVKITFDIICLQV